MLRSGRGCPCALSVILAYQEEPLPGFTIENKPRGGRETATGLLASTEISQEDLAGFGLGGMFLLNS